MQNDTTNNQQSGVTPFVSFETAWASLQPALNEAAAKRTKKKRRFIFFLFSFLIIGLGGASWYLYNNHKHVFSSVAKNGAPPIKSVETNTQLLPKQATESVTSIGSSQMKQHSNEIGLTKHKGQHPTDDNTYLENIKTKGFQVKTKKLLHTDKKNIYLPNTTLLESEFVSKSEKVNKYVSTSLIATKNAISIQDSIKNGVFTDSVNQLMDSILIHNCITQTPNKFIKKHTKGISFGIQLNAPVQTNAYSINTKSQEDPLTYLIPTFFITKQLTPTSGLLAAINPYAQYYLQDRVTLYSNDYFIQLQRGSTQNNDPLQYTATQSLAISKLIGIEASVFYQYWLTHKVQIGVGVGHFWLQKAIFQQQISQSDIGVTQKDFYSINRKNSDWMWVNNNFFSGKIETSYNIKKLAIGLNANAPLNHIANRAINNKQTVTKNVFLRWTFR